MKLKLHTTVFYRGEKCLAGSVIDVKQEDVAEMKNHGELLEGEPVSPVQETPSNAPEGDLSNENGSKDEIPTEPKKTPVKRNTGAKKANTRKTNTKK